ncbi:hypothetical protein ACF9IK_30555 [Kitasatospora hibisci]|uniref:hypothetical protein n=1 Tax=Kitasatospora hibisci TaxID=3369522 RepID=UPI0037548596
MLDEVVRSWPAVPTAGPLPSPGLVGAQLFALRVLHTGLTDAALRPADPFAAPEQAAAARRERRATTRAASLTAIALQRVSEVLELADAHELSPTPIVRQHAQWLYRDAGEQLSSAAHLVRQNSPAPRAAAKPNRPAPDAEQSRLPSRSAAARLRSALAHPFRKSDGADRTDHGPAPTASPAKRR